MIENEFTSVMAKKSNEALIKITTIDRENYQQPALDAAESELKK